MLKVFQCLMAAAVYLLALVLSSELLVQIWPGVRLVPSAHAQDTAGAPSKPNKPLAPQRGARIDTQQESASATPRIALRENPKDGLMYVWIPPGTFLMGCSTGDNGCWPWEKPAHQVTISRGFWLGQMVVTVGAYKRCAAATGHPMPFTFGMDGGWEKVNDSMPIVNVCWNDAHDYCTWVGGRLPSEAEWEYAARAGTTEAYYGSLDEIAWYRDNSARQVHPVAEKLANGFGLYDMLGNVREWVNDWYDKCYYQNSPSQDPMGPSNGTERVQRGGTSSHPPGAIRVSCRHGVRPDGANNGNGFRCGGEVFAP